MGRGLRQHQRHRHIQEMLATERETAAVLGELEARLPADVYRKMEAGLGGKSYTERFDHAMKLASAVQAMVEITEEAERISLAGDGTVTIEGQGQRFDGLRADWRVMAHLALKAGFQKTGQGRLEKQAAQLQSGAGPDRKGR